VHRRVSSALTPTSRLRSDTSRENWELGRLSTAACRSPMTGSMACAAAVLIEGVSVFMGFFGSRESGIATGVKGLFSDQNRARYRRFRVHGEDCPLGIRGRDRQILDAMFPTPGTVDYASLRFSPRKWGLPSVPDIAGRPQNGSKISPKHPRNRKSVRWMRNSPLTAMFPAPVRNSFLIYPPMG